MAMSEPLLRVPEVARALDLDGTQVYALIDCDELKAAKGRDGLVYVSQQALEDYRQRRATASR
jgi:hypothetical protein